MNGWLFIPAALCMAATYLVDSRRDSPGNNLLRIVSLFGPMICFVFMASRSDLDDAAHRKFIDALAYGSAVAAGWMWVLVAEKNFQNRKP